MSPKLRQTFYGLGTIASALLTLLTVWKVVDPETATSLSSVVAGLVGLFGTGAVATAAVGTGKQRSNGTFDPVSPADQVINGVRSVIVAKNNAEQDLRRVQDVIESVAAQIPGLGPLATQVLKHIPKV